MSKRVHFFLSRRRQPIWENDAEEIRQDLGRILQELGSGEGLSHFFTEPRYNCDGLIIFTSLRGAEYVQPLLSFVERHRPTWRLQQCNDQAHAERKTLDRERMRGRPIDPRRNRLPEWTGQTPPAPDNPQLVPEAPPPNVSVEKQKPTRRNSLSSSRERSARRSHNTKRSHRRRSTRRSDSDSSSLSRSSSRSDSHKSCLLVLRMTADKEQLKRCRRLIEKSKATSDVPKKSVVDAIEENVTQNLDKQFDRYFLEVCRSNKRYKLETDQEFYRYRGLSEKDALEKLRSITAEEKHHRHEKKSTVRDESLGQRKLELPPEESQLCKPPQFVVSSGDRGGMPAHGSPKRIPWKQKPCDYGARPRRSSPRFRDQSSRPTTSANPAESAAINISSHDGSWNKDVDKTATTESAGNKEDDSTQPIKDSAENSSKVSSFWHQVQEMPQSSNSTDNSSIEGPSRVSHCSQRILRSIQGSTTTPSLPHVVQDFLSRVQARDEVVEQLMSCGLRGEPPQGASGKREQSHPSASLPIEKYKKRLMDIFAHEDSPVCIVSGDTGCGKSTKVPQYILELSQKQGKRGAVIFCSQPRRLAAVSVARRVAQEMGTGLGNLVGYHIGERGSVGGFKNSRLSKSTRILYMTTGVLLKRLISCIVEGPSESNASFQSSLTSKQKAMVQKITTQLHAPDEDDDEDSRIFQDLNMTHVVLDEVHERQMEVDLVMVIVKFILTKRRDIKIVVMSAVLDVDLLSRYFSSAEIERLRNYDYQELVSEDRDTGWSTAGDRYDWGDTTSMSTWDTHHSYEEEDKFVGECEENDSPESSARHNSGKKKTGPMHRNKRKDEECKEVPVVRMTGSCHTVDVCHWSQVMEVLLTDVPKDYSLSEYEKAILALEEDLFSSLMQNEEETGVSGYITEPHDLRGSPHSRLTLYEVVARLITIMDKQMAERGDGRLLSFLVFCPGWNEQEGVLRAFLADAAAESSNPTDAVSSTAGKKTQILSQVEQLISEVETANSNLQMLWIHSQQTAEELDKVFTWPKRNRRKIIVATNIAETSLTIPDVGVVIDLALNKQQVFNIHSGFTSLKLQWASQSALQQRTGRAGRVRKGLTFRLVPKDAEFSMFADCEMSRLSLEKVIIDVKRLDSAIETQALLAECLEPPSLPAVENAIRRLIDVGAIVQVNKAFPTGVMTPIGSFCSLMPCDLAVSRLILFGLALGCPYETLLMAAVISTDNHTIMNTKEKDIRRMIRIVTRRMEIGENVQCDPLVDVITWEKTVSEAQRKPPSTDATLSTRLRSILRKGFNEKMRNTGVVPRAMQQAEESRDALRSKLEKLIPSFKDAVCQRFLPEEQSPHFWDRLIIVKLCYAAACYPNLYRTVEQQASLNLFSRVASNGVIRQAERMVSKDTDSLKCESWLQKGIGDRVGTHLNPNVSYRNLLATSSFDLIDMDDARGIFACVQEIKESSLIASDTIKMHHLQSRAPGAALLLQFKDPQEPHLLVALQERNGGVLSNPLTGQIIAHDLTSPHSVSIDALLPTKGFLDVDRSTSVVPLIPSVLESAREDVLITALRTVSRKATRSMARHARGETTVLKDVCAFPPVRGLLDIILLLCAPCGRLATRRNCYSLFDVNCGNKFKWRFSVVLTNDDLEVVNYLRVVLDNLLTTTLRKGPKAVVDLQQKFQRMFLGLIAQPRPVASHRLQSELSSHFPLHNSLPFVEKYCSPKEIPENLNLLMTLTESGTIVDGTDNRLKHEAVVYKAFDLSTESTSIAQTQVYEHLLLLLLILDSNPSLFHISKILHPELRALDTSAEANFMKKIQSLSLSQRGVLWVCAEALVHYQHARRQVEHCLLYNHVLGQIAFRKKLQRDSSRISLLCGFCEMCVCDQVEVRRPDELLEAGYKNAVVVKCQGPVFLSTKWGGKFSEDIPRMKADMERIYHSEVELVGCFSSHPIALKPVNKDLLIIPDTSSVHFMHADRLLIFEERLQQMMNDAANAFLERQKLFLPILPTLHAPLVKYSANAEEISAIIERGRNNHCVRILASSFTALPISAGVTSNVDDMESAFSLCSTEGITTLIQRKECPVCSSYRNRRFPASRTVGKSIASYEKIDVNHFVIGSSTSELHCNFMCVLA